MGDVDVDLDAGEADVVEHDYGAAEGIGDFDFPRCTGLVWEDDGDA